MDATPIQENQTMEETTPRQDMRTAANRRPRDREHLTPNEVVELIAAARKGRWGIRDAALLITMYVHGLRASEAIRYSIESPIGLKSFKHELSLTASAEPRSDAKVEHR
jgi:site-specific recombinase XerD